MDLKIFRIYIPYWITRLSFSVRLLTKIRIHISETFLKRFRLYFQWIISNAQTENLKNIMLRQIGQSVLSAKKGRGTRKGSITIIFLKGGRYSEQRLYVIPWPISVPTDQEDDSGYSGQTCRKRDFWKRKDLFIINCAMLYESE